MSFSKPKKGPVGCPGCSRDLNTWDEMFDHFQKSRHPMYVLYDRGNDFFPATRDEQDLEFKCPCGLSTIHSGSIQRHADTCKSKFVCPLPKNLQSLLPKFDSPASSLMDEREKAVQERESALAERESALAERESALAERESALAEKEERLDKLLEVLHPIAGQLASLLRPSTDQSTPAPNDPPPSTSSTSDPPPSTSSTSDPPPSTSNPPPSTLDPQPSTSLQTLSEEIDLSDSVVASTYVIPSLTLSYRHDDVDEEDERIAKAKQLEQYNGSHARVDNWNCGYTYNPQQGVMFPAEGRAPEQDVQDNPDALDKDDKESPSHIQSRSWPEEFYRAKTLSYKYESDEEQDRESPPCTHSHSPTPPSSPPEKRNKEQDRESPPCTHSHSPTPSSSSPEKRNTHSHSPPPPSSPPPEKRNKM